MSENEMACIWDIPDYQLMYLVALANFKKKIKKNWQFDISVVIKSTAGFDWLMLID